MIALKFIFVVIVLQEACFFVYKFLNDDDAISLLTLTITVKRL